jgi:ribulose-bisphosphate carboxylase small chain
MRITQGAFSFLPDLSDEQIAAQLAYALDHGWAIAIEHTDDPHPRNAFWEMWGQPLFDLQVEQADVALREVRACREAHPRQYVKVAAYDNRLGRQTTALSFIVNRPPDEPGFRLDRTETHDRVIRYSLHAYATEQPAGRRYGAGAASGGPDDAPAG